MRKIVILLVLVINLTLIYGQKTYTESFDSLFVNISRTDATTGILYDRVVPFAALDRYNPLEEIVDTSNANHFIQAYNELNRATFLPSAQFVINTDSLEKKIAEMKNSNIVPIGLLHCQFNVIDTSVAFEKLIFDQDSVLIENPSCLTSLYQQKTAFIVSPLLSNVHGGSVVFIINEDFIFDNTASTITGLQIDFGDGAGLRNITFNSSIIVDYLNDGLKTLHIITTHSNGSHSSAFAKINCIFPRPLTRSMPPPSRPYDDVAITSQIAYQGFGTGTLRIYYKDDSRQLTKPVLMVDGFDPGNVRKFESHDNNKKSFWDMLAYNNGNEHIGLTLIEKGYDLVMLDLPDGGGYIEKNGMVCIEAINEINRRLQANNSSEEIVVVGPSMGGQITRFALAFMESHPHDENTNYGKHNCRLWVSFDSPHQGANISLGAQAFMYFFGYIGGISNAKAVWDNTINCIAAKQMLVKQFNIYTSSLIFPQNNSTCDLSIYQCGFNPYFTNYYNTINQMGYPSDLRKIAISNGSLGGTLTGSGCGEAIELDAPANVRVSKIQLFPSNSQCEIFYGAFGTKWNFFWGIRKKLWVRANADTQFCSIDAAPGATYDTFDQIEEAASGLEGSIKEVTKWLSGHCFMPVTSVLDINGNMNYCTDISNRDLVAEGRTPFASYWGPIGTNSNMDHISFDSDLADWVLKEIETYTQGPREITPCGTHEYSVHLPQGVSSSTEVLWTCSDNLRIVSGQGTKTMQIECLSTNSDTWVQATVASLTHSNLVTNAPNLAQSKKQLKKYHIGTSEFSSHPLAQTTITQSTPWNTPYRVDQSVTVKSGRTLTVKSSVFLSSHAQITLEPGAKLILDGGTLTTGCETEMWEGVVVEGNPNLPLNQSYQGYIEIKNGGKISNAECAITVNGGGIVKATNAHFENNTVGVKFNQIASTQSGTSGTFTNTHFVINEDYLGDPSDFQTHLNMQRCGNISISGCHFSVYPPLEDYTNKGILVKNTRVDWFNENYLTSTPITLQYGADMYIKNTTTIFSDENTKITVEPAGTLLVIGGTLTNMFENQRWGGIIVRGQSNMPTTSYSLYHGYVNLRNGATIANARCGILVQDSENSVVASGRINAHEAHFINNYTAVAFGLINRSSSARSALPRTNNSNFKKCHFSSTAVPFCQVFLGSVHGVKFIGCDFENQDMGGISIPHNPPERGLVIPNSAIYAVNSGFTVDGFCNTPPGVYTIDGQCPEEYFKHSTFTGFSKAIIAANSGANQTFTVENSIFNNNTTAIRASGVNSLFIRYSNFNVGKSGSEENCGIELDETPHFTLEENYFKSNYYEKGTGLRVKNSGANNNEVYKNEYDGFFRGQHFDGSNKESGNIIGLTSVCNTFGNILGDDIYVSGDPSTSEFPQGIGSHQKGIERIGNVNHDRSAGNCFSFGAKYNYGNSIGSLIYYLSNPYNSCEFPWFNYGINIEGITSHSCPSRKVTGRTPLELEDWRVWQWEWYGEAKSAFSNLEYNYNQLIDGGNSEQLLNAIQGEWSDDVWKIRQELMRKSPYVSQQVLLEVAEKNALPQALYLEICLANPDATKDHNFLNILQYKIPNPLPAYMISLIEASWSQKTLRTDMEAMLSSYGTLKDNYLDKLIHERLSDSIIDRIAVNNLYRDRGDYSDWFAMAEGYLAELDFESAYNMMYELENRKLTKEQESEIYSFREYINWMQNLAADSNSVYTLREWELESLLNYVEKNVGRGKALAKIILCELYGICIEDIPEKSNFVSHSSHGHFVQEPSLGSVEVFPNPAKDHVTFEWDFGSFSGTALLTISDLAGHQILSRTLQGSQGQWVWDTRNISNGTYVYQVVTDGFDAGSGKVVIAR